MLGSDISRLSVSTANKNYLDFESHYTKFQLAIYVIPKLAQGKRNNEFRKKVQYIAMVGR